MGNEPKPAERSGLNDNLRVAYVTQWFPPEPVQVPLWIAQALRRQGLDVTVLTGVPNYPTGKVQPGFTAWKASTEIREGFRVVRSPLYPSHDHSAIGRLANYTSFAAASAITGGALLRSADVALVYSSPATAAGAPLMSRAVSGTPYVLLIQDLWPDSVFATGFITEGHARRVAETALGWFTDLTYRRAAHVAVTSPGMRDLLIDRGVPASKVSVVYNWVDEDVFKPSEPDEKLRPELGIDDEFLILYAGNHGPAQALDVAVKAMSEIRDLPVHLVFIGDGVDKQSLRSLAKGLDLGNVHFLDPVNPDRIPALMAAADLQLVSLADQDLFRITLPSKVQSVLACGEPLLVCAPGDAARVVTEAKAGFASPPGDASELARVIRRAHGTPKAELRGMGDAGRAHYTATLSEAINARALADLLREAAKTRKGA